MKIIVAVIVAFAASLLWASVTPPAIVPVPTFGHLSNGLMSITYPLGSDPSRYIWYVECAPSPTGPFDYCKDCRYFGSNIYIGFRPNTFYRLRGITNF